MGLYRLLERGEAIRPGDEVLLDDCETWGEIEGWTTGNPYDPALLVPMRRRVSEQPVEALTPEQRAASLDGDIYL